MPSKTFTQFCANETVLLAPDPRAVISPLVGVVDSVIAGGDYQVRVAGETCVYRGYQLEQYSSERYACLLACMLRNARKRRLEFTGKLAVLCEISQHVESVATTAFENQLTMLEIELRTLGYNPNEV
jgi:hypothetical protein